LQQERSQSLELQHDRSQNELLVEVCAREGRMLTAGGCGMLSGDGGCGGDDGDDEGGDNKSSRFYLAFAFFLKQA
jgi:hypothetical protein